ncbi:uncharacterized protein LODBEIA_P13410 [Lodderomyces beijingensis]|uniref:Large ribosomal subunit protein mL50 n=1 Tax=Lodderomyces beijingensis TaxID=1775926 RepID=A0ABP0ZI42_9ASCO
MSTVVRQIIPRRTHTRSFTTTPATRSWFGDMFGRNKKKITDKTREDIISHQDELAEKEITTIKHLTRKNSDAYYASLKANAVLPSSKVKNWKARIIPADALESAYDDKEKLRSIVSEVYEEVRGDSGGDATGKLSFAEYRSVDLGDLKFRFNLVKALQSRLGFEFNDYTVTKSHDLMTLYEEIENVVNRRWKSERNPNAIVLRPEDFTAGNIHLSEERTEKQQKQIFSTMLNQIKTQGGKTGEISIKQNK